MRKKKICFVLEKLSMGGVEVELIQLLNIFDYSKYDVTLYLRDKNGSLFKRINKNIDVRFWQYTNGLQNMWNRMLCHVYLDNYDMNSYYAARCIYNSKEKFDCVIGYKALSPFCTEIAAEKFIAKKRVLWVHGRTVVEQKNYRFYEKIYNKFDKIFCVSNGTQRDFNTLFPTCKDKTEILYNIIDADDVIKKSEMYQPEEMMNLNQIIICSVGRLSPVKGFSMVPKIMKILLNENYDVKWFIVGDGEDRDKLIALIRDAGLQDRIVLLGEKENPYPYIRYCNIYVQPSFSEGFSLTTEEAKVLMKPIVITDVSGLRERICNGENGLIVESRNPEALATAIISLIRNPELSEKFKRNLSKENINNSQEVMKLYKFLES